MVKEIDDYIDVIAVAAKLLDYEVTQNNNSSKHDLDLFKDKKGYSIDFYKQIGRETILLASGFYTPERVLRNPTTTEAIQKLEEFMNKL